MLDKYELETGVPAHDFPKDEEEGAYIPFESEQELIAANMARVDTAYQINRAADQLYEITFRNDNGVKRLTVKRSPDAPAEVFAAESLTDALLQAKAQRE